VEPPEYLVEFPTLWVVPAWIQRHCTIPDGDHKGEPFRLYDWQLWCTANHYRVKPRARVGQKAPAFFYRRSQVIAPQKTGKGPWSASIISAEAIGPSVFAGWAVKGDVYRCRDHGCGCGWVYKYHPGDPMGRPWATPLIQLLASAEDQTDNVYRPLQAMARDDRMAGRMRVGEQFIRLPNDGRIDVVTSSALARLGNPITHALQDETQLYTAQNKLIRVAETQRRGLAGMGGRAVETTNCPDPTVDSTARRTMEAKAQDVFRFHRLPPAHLDYADPDERRQIHAYVYAGSQHVLEHDGLDAIESEAVELAEKDPAQAERFYGNRPVAGSGSAFSHSRWLELGNPARVKAGKDPISMVDRSLVVVGVDGARFRDSLAIIGTDVRRGHQWPLAIIERPPDAPDDYEHDFEAADRAMLDVFASHDVWRVYCDPQFIEGLVERWQGRWGDKVVVEWFTYRKRPMCFALQAYRAAMTAGDLSNDGDPTMAGHIANATRRMTNVVDDEGRPMWVIEKPEESRKIDAAMAGCLSWECRGDAIAANAQPPPKHKSYAF
jgi:hypothetical protein